MSYKLFLDDFRTPPDVDWILVNSYETFVERIERYGLPYLISFDHDLAAVHYPVSREDLSKAIDYSAYREKTGYHCALWLIEYCEKNDLLLPDWTVHSQNPVGRENIKQLLSKYQQEQFKRKVKSEVGSDTGLLNRMHP